MRSACGYGNIYTVKLVLTVNLDNLIATTARGKPPIIATVTHSAPAECANCRECDAVGTEDKQVISVKRGERGRGKVVKIAN